MIQIQRTEQSGAACGHHMSGSSTPAIEDSLSRKQRGEEAESEETVLKLRGEVEDFLHLQIRTNLEVSRAETS